MSPTERPDRQCQLELGPVAPSLQHHIKRDDRVAQIVGRENVIAGTDCGLGGRVHADLAWAKLRTLAEGARLASKSLWPS